jgi:hypothetical protein
MAAIEFPTLTTNKQHVDFDQLLEMTAVSFPK